MSLHSKQTLRLLSVNHCLVSALKVLEMLRSDSCISQNLILCGILTQREESENEGER